MSPIEIRELSRDFQTGIVNFWNRNLGKPYWVNEKTVSEKIFNDPDLAPEASFLMTDGAKPAGFIVSKVNNSGLPECDNHAWISAFIIDKEYRNRGFGKTLYAKAEAKLRESGVKKIILGGERNNFFSGIPEPTPGSEEFFRKKGYVINNDLHYDLMADLSKIDFKVLPVPLNHDAAYSTTEMVPADRPGLEAFFDQSFPGRWKYEILGYLDRGGDFKNVLLLRHQQTVAGFCKVFISEGPSDQDEFFGSFWGALGPVGISAAMRGKGLGKRILHDSLCFLQGCGAHNVLIDWTVLKNFYGQFCFEPRRTYRGAYKCL